MMNNIILTIFQEDMVRVTSRKRVNALFSASRILPTSAGPKDRTEPKTGLFVASFNQLTIIRAKPCFYLLLGEILKKIILNSFISVGYAVGVTLFLVGYIIFHFKLISRVHHFIRIFYWKVITEELWKVILPTHSVNFLMSIYISKWFHHATLC